MRIDVQDFKELARNNSNLSSFSEDALEKIFENLEETNEDVSYDPVAINCEWTEFDEEELISQYDYLIDDSDEDDDDEDEKLDSLLEELNSRTTCYKLSNGSYLVAEF